MKTIITITDADCTITTDKETATALLFKNPQCSSEINGDQVTLTYDIDNINTVTSLLNHRRKS
jgi:hypothetical protein